MHSSRALTAQFLVELSSHSFVHAPVRISVMVYRGKPSAACEECRKRRTRCNRAVPACAQCIKAKRICPGYRNTTDLMFFDQSHQVAKKSKWQDTTSAGTSSAKASTASGMLRVVPRYSAPIQLNDVVLYQPLDEMGINFFMRNYVGSNPKASQFGFLPDYYFTEGSGYAELQQSLKAVGLAGFAKNNNRPDLLPPATKSYISAVRDINKALSHPNSAAREATLISVLLLAMFEVMILPRAEGFENLTKHLKGAVSVALLCLRQNKITDVTKKLLVTVIQSAIMDSWIQNRPLPPGLLDLKREVGSRSKSESDRPDFLDLVVELVEFRTDLSRKNSSPPFLVSSKALIIDDSLRRFTESMPRHLLFEKMFEPTESRDLVYDGYYHVYPVTFMSHMWNNIRLSRLQLHQVVLNKHQEMARMRQGSMEDDRSSPSIGSQSSAGNAPLSSQEANSEAVVRDMAREICATIPQLANYMTQLPSYVEKKRKEAEEKNLNFLRDRGASQKTPLSRPAAPDIPRPIMAVADPRPASLYHMFYQLHTLSSVPMLLPDMRQWIQGRLHSIEQTADLDDLNMLRLMMRKTKGI